MKFQKITIDEKQMNGVACIRNLRIPVSVVVGMLGEGFSFTDIIDHYPDLDDDDIRECLLYASEMLQERELPLVI
jgi:uncharacterized protein (DUF433 family)